MIKMERNDNVGDANKGNFFEGIGYSVFFAFIGAMIGVIFYFAISYEQGRLREIIAKIILPLPFIILNVYGYFKMKEIKTKIALLISSIIIFLIFFLPLYIVLWRGGF